MKYGSLPTDQWVENCIRCRVPMEPVIADYDDVVLVGTTWTSVKDSPLWYCKTCSSVNTIYRGQWVKTSFDQPIQRLTVEQEILVNELVIDRSKPPFIGATLCPHCHKWREVISTSILGMGETRKIVQMHFCITCHSGEEITRDQREDIVKQAFLTGEHLTADDLT